MKVGDTVLIRTGFEMKWTAGTLVQVHEGMGRVACNGFECWRRLNLIQKDSRTTTRQDAKHPRRTPRKSSKR